MIKRLIAILASMALLLYLPGCAAQETPVGKHTESPTTETRPEVKHYPGDNKLVHWKYQALPPKEIYTTTGEENGLGGTLYMVLGTMEEHIEGEPGEIAFFRISTVEGDVIFADPVSYIAASGEMEQTMTIAQYNQLRSFYPIPSIGETVWIYGEYQGMSNRFGCPSFMYGTEDYMLDVLIEVMSERLFELPEATETAPAVTTEPTEAPAKGTLDNPYTAGMYKVGTDLPEGEYLFFPTDDYGGYVCAYTDSTQDDIIENENISGPFFMTVKSGQYLQAEWCVFIVAADHTVNINADGSFGEGMYRVGIDIPAGEYKLTTTDGYGYWCLYNNSIIPFDIENNNNFEGGTYVTVKEGQYFLIHRCIATPVK